MAALALAAAASTAAAQNGGLSAAHLGAAFGISFPVGDLSSGHSSGFNLAGTADFNAPGQAMGLRGELFYEHFSAKNGYGGAGSAQAAATIVNAVYHFQGQSFHPYLIGGMGLYWVTQQSARPGFNAGAGFDIPLTGMTAHFEARIHKVLTNGRSYVSLPISFGLSF
jgi:hypothetical protein